MITKEVDAYSVCRNCQVRRKDIMEFDKTLPLNQIVAKMKERTFPCFMDFCKECDNHTVFDLVLIDDKPILKND